MFTIPTLYTERLILRPWKEADFDDLALFYADRATAEFVGGACGRDDAWRRMATFVGHWYFRGYGYWAIEEKATGRFSGLTGLWFPEGWPEPEVSWSLLKAAQGRGYATEAAARARAFGYSEIGFETLISLIELSNKASVAVANRLGAQLEKTTMLRGGEVGVFRHPRSASSLPVSRQST